MVQRLKDKRGKGSPEGAAVDALVDIRVIADPHWEADEIRVNLLFLIPEAGAADDPLTDEDWELQVEAWAALCTPAGHISEVKALALHVDELVVADYLPSDPLDIEYLTPTRG